MADKFFDAMFTASVIGGSSGPAPVIVAKNITANGTYSALDDQADGFNPVVVDVPNTYTAADEGKVVSNGQLVAQTAATYTTNGTYDTTTNNNVIVNVQSQNNALYANSPTTFTFATNLRSINIPEGITTINNAFYGNTGLENVTLPQSLTTIGNSAFYGCSKLTKITIPSAVTSIYVNSFGSCTSLATITINKPEGSISGAPWGAPYATVVWTG